VIERFNFYDVYGYLLPGIFVTVLLWLPAGILLDIWPAAGWSSAVLALVLAYLAGQVLENLSSASLPSNFRDANDRSRKPSDLLFDADEQQVLSQRLWALRTPIANQIQHDFGIDVQPGAEWSQAISGSRTVAFFKCRNVLIKQKAAAYAEQQQGMYVLMRGMTAGLIVAAALYFGIAIGISVIDGARWGRLLSVVAFAALAAAFVFGCVAVAFQRKPRRNERKLRAFAFWLLIFALFCGGASLGGQLSILRTAVAIPAQLADGLREEKDPAKFEERARALDRLKLNAIRHLNPALLMFLLGTIAATLAPLCWSAYREFAVNFAATVYLDYYRNIVGVPPAG
jgi:hypothetical protein